MTIFWGKTTATRVAEIIRSYTNSFTGHHRWHRWNLLISPVTEISPVRFTVTTLNMIFCNSPARLHLSNAQNQQQRNLTLGHWCATCNQNPIYAYGTRLPLRTSAQKFVEFQPCAALWRWSQSSWDNSLRSGVLRSGVNIALWLALERKKNRWKSTKLWSAHRQF